MNNLKNFLLIFFLSMSFMAFNTDDTSVDDSLQIELIDTATTPAVAIIEDIETVETAADDLVFGPVPDKIIDLATSIQWWEWLFILAFNLLGYLSPYIPVLRKIGDTEMRVGAGAVVIILIFVSMDVTEAWKLVFAFFASTKLYEKIFKLIKKTPKPTIPAVITTGGN